MATKKGIYFADAAEQLLGEISSGRVNQVLDRYAEILRRERSEQLFGEAEWSALRDMLNGVISEPAGMIRGSLAMGWEDSLEDGIAEKWDVDPTAMLAKLRALTFVQEVAVIEAVAVWWRQQR
jgi:hypothetical protein